LKCEKIFSSHRGQRFNALVKDGFFSPSSLWRLLWRLGATASRKRRPPGASLYPEIRGIAATW
jgi:hypothetical protein